MRVNTITQTFEDLSPEETQELRSVCWDLVVHGTITDRTRYFFEFWRTELGYDDRQGLLLMSTAFPQRALLSLVF